MIRRGQVAHSRCSSFHALELNSYGLLYTPNGLLLSPGLLKELYHKSDLKFVMPCYNASQSWIHHKHLTLLGKA